MPKRQILLLEGEENLERILTLLLKQADFDVSRCRLADTAFAKIKAGAHRSNWQDLIIIDIGGADKEGGRLCRKLTAAGINAPMILIVPYGNRVEAAGADCNQSSVVLHSPFEPADLLNCIERATNNFNLQA